MKKIVTLALILGLLLVVAPWGIGQLAEKRVNAGLDKLVQEAPYLKIVERKWTPGWFRSEQQVTFEAFGDWAKVFNDARALGEAANAPAPDEDEGEAENLPVENSDTPAEATAEATPPVEEVAPSGEAAPMEPMRFTVRNEILHGPVLWPVSLGIARVNSKLVLSEEVRAKLVEIFGTDEPVRISTRVAFFGGGTTSFSGDGRNIQFEDEPVTMAYDAFHFDVSYGKNADKLDLDGSWPKFEVNGKDGQHVLVTGMTLTGESQRVLGELYDSDFEFVIGEMSFSDRENSAFSVTNTRYVVNTSLEDDFMDFGAKLGSGAVKSEQLKELQLDLKEVHYDFTLRRLHAATLDKMVTAMKASYTEPVVDASVLNAVLTAPLKEYGMELLKHDPELSIDRIGIVTADGDANITGVIRLKGATAQDFETGALSLIPKIDADITIEVAQKLIDKVPNGGAGAGMAVDQGYAKRQGEKLVSRIEFKAGQLKINGKAQGIPGLGGPPPEAMGPEQAPGE
jgi:uncharacterized protein YdgA (DUF945 family)